MPTMVIYGDSADGQVRSANVVYATAWSAGTLTATDDNFLWSGQQFGADYRVYESFISFDTSAVTTATAVVMSLYVSVLSVIGSNFTCNARLHDWGASVTTANWIAGGSLSANTLLATKATTAMAAGTYTDFVAESAFASSLTNPLRMVLCSDRTEAGTTSTSEERVVFYAANNTGTTQDPYITVTIPAQNLYPDADTTTTGWTATPLWSKIEESSADGTIITATAA